MVDRYMNRLLTYVQICDVYVVDNAARLVQARARRKARQHPPGARRWKRFRNAAVWSETMSVEAFSECGGVE